MRTGPITAAERPIDWAERLALGASVACLVHCLGLPLAIAALPALSSLLSVPESFHHWVLALAMPLAFLALLHGRARHGHAAPLATGLIGLALLAIGALLLGETDAEMPVTVGGSLLLGGAHIANWRLRHACAC